MTERQFPIHPGCWRILPKLPRSVPWSLVEPHEKQALSNHDQTLERLAQRGGLTWMELADVIEGKKWNGVVFGGDNDPRLMLHEAGAAVRVLEKIK